LNPINLPYELKAFEFVENLKLDPVFKELFKTDSPYKNSLNTCKMKSQRFLVTLTLVNFIILLVVLLLFSTAFKPDVVPVLRGHAFELVDDNGKVRAEIKLLPAEPTLKMPDGTVGYPETVLFRLIDSNGGPNVKISAMDDGSGLVLGSESGYIQILSRSEEPILRLKKNDGKERIIKIE
jgi:hypothetical protein